MGLVFSSCNNELDPLSPDFQTYPVVYSVLEVNRDTLAVRVTHSFRGRGSALDYARIEDSIYYPDARVWLEKWNGDLRVAKAELVKTRLSPKIPGIFVEDPNWQFIVIRTPDTETLFSGTLSNLEYHLSVEIPGIPLICASTKAYPQAQLQSPRLSFTSNLFQDPLQFEWSNPAPYSELYFRMYYSDVYQDTSISRTLSWREYHSAVQENRAIESVFGQDMMKRIAGQVKNDPLVRYRHVTGFQVVIVGIPEDLYDYRQMIAIAPSDQIGFPVTNMINAIGLFTSQTLVAFDLPIDARSRDSIMNGKYTKHLKFRYY
ncbi:MAG: hypothetical protein V2A67_08875 [Bacteroidota bacterium]